MPDPYRLPTTNLSFSVCSTTIGNAAPAPADDLSADYLFRYNWTAQNALGIKGYGASENSGADRIANTPAGSQVNLSSYTNINVRGDNTAFGGGPGSYWLLWDNQLTGGNDNFSDLYLNLYDSTKTFQLTTYYLATLSNSTNTGYINIGNAIPLVQYAYWEVIFTMGTYDSNPITFELLCDINNGGTPTSIFGNTNNFGFSTQTFAWNDGGGNLSVETANPSAGYAFSMLFY